MGAKVEFPIGKKLFHLVVNPGTSLCPTVAAWNWYKLGETDKWNTKFRSGKQSHLFRFSTFSGNFPVGRTDETCSIYRRTGNPEILTKWKAPQNTSPCSTSPCNLHAEITVLQNHSMWSFHVYRVHFR